MREERNMKLIANRILLLEGLNAAQKAVSQKSSIPSLEGVLLSTDEIVLKIVGYDLEFGIESRVEVNVEEQGAVVLNARMLGEIVRKLPDETVLIEVDEKLLTTIKSGLSEFTILGLDPNEFPEMPHVSEEKHLGLKQETLKDMIRQTIYATSTNETRPVLMGALFEVEENLLRVVAVDGFRMSIREEAIENTTGEEAFRFIVPGKTLNEMSKILKDDESEISLAISQKHMIARFDHCTVVSRLLEGEFMDYKKVIPAEVNTTVKFDRSEMIDSVERVSLIISEKIKNPVRCKFEFDTAKIHCKTAMGVVKDEIRVSVNGEGLEIGFNGRYMLDALKNCSEDELSLEMNTAISPMVIRPMEGTAFLYMIVPMRFKTDE